MKATTDKVKLAWISHIQDLQERESFKRDLLARQDIWDKLRSILADKLEAAEMSHRDYDSASWAFKQAHANGYKDALLEVYDILPGDGD